MSSQINYGAKGDKVKKIKKFREKIIKIKEKIKDLFKDYSEDILITGGLAFINWASYTITLSVGLYTTGFTLLILGIYFSIFPTKRG